MTESANSVPFRLLASKLLIPLSHLLARSEPRPLERFNSGQCIDHLRGWISMAATLERKRDDYFAPGQRNNRKGPNKSVGLFLFVCFARAINLSFHRAGSAIIAQRRPAAQQSLARSAQRTNGQADGWTDTIVFVWK